jgi:hypothetical protein
MQPMTLKRVRQSFSRDTDESTSVAIFARIRQVIFGLGFAGFAMFMMVMVSQSIVQHFKIKKWAQAECVIVKSVVEEKDDDAGVYAVNLAYQYAYAGKNYTARNIDVGRKSYSGKLAEAQAFAAQFPEKKKLTCFVNPKNPEEAYLSNRFPTEPLAFVAFISLFMVAGFGVILGVALVFREKEKSGNEPQAERIFPASTKKPKKSKSDWKLALFGLPFFCMGSFFFYGVGVRPLMEKQRSQDWVQTPCVIQRIQVKAHSGSKRGSTYSVYARYAYVWEGREFVGERFNFSSGSDSTRTRKDKAVYLYSKMENPVCYVNPAAPKEAVLERTAGDLILLPLLLGGLFAVVGLALMIGGFLQRKQKALYDEATAHSPVPLPVKSSPLSVCIYSFIFSVIWNGTIFFVGYFFLEDLTLKEIRWFSIPALLIALFGFVGIAVFANALWMALASFGPKVEVVMKPVLRLGEAVPLQWRLKGDIGNIQSLKVELVCEERKNGQDEGTMVRDTLLAGEVFEPLTSNSGVMKLHISEYVAPTEKSGIAKIDWKLRLVLRHRCLPKQKWEFKVIVAV